MKPEVYSHFAREWGLQRSLPERLFDHYHQMETVTDCNVIFLTKNYRCHPDILRFPSDNFYGKGLISCSEEPTHPRLGPMLFFSAIGVEEAVENSYVNVIEANEVAKRVKELSEDWPVEWGDKDLSKIGVISAYMTQVKLVKYLLTPKTHKKGGIKFPPRKKNLIIAALESSLAIRLPLQRQPRRLLLGPRTYFFF